MKAVILAAGYGSRLGNHTRDVPKALLSIGGRPILDYTLEILSKHRVKDVVIVTGYKAHKIEHFVKKYNLNFNFVHNSHYRTTNNIYSLYLAMEEIGEGFYIINSDVFFHPDIFEYLHTNDEQSLVLSVDTVKKLGEEEMKVIIEEEKVTRISKKIPPSEADGEYIGIAKVPEKAIPDLRTHIEIVMEKQGKRVFYEEAFQSMMDAGVTVGYESTRGLPWIEIDTPLDLRSAREKILPKIMKS
jgi:choline kinase